MSYSNTRVQEYVIDLYVTYIIEGAQCLGLGDKIRGGMICAASAPPELASGDALATDELTAALASFITVSELSEHHLDERELDFLNCAAAYLPLHVLTSRATCGLVLPVIDFEGGGSVSRVQEEGDLPVSTGRLFAHLIDLKSSPPLTSLSPTIL